MGRGTELPPGILVTATSRNHFQQLHGLIRSAQVHLPSSWRFVVYDLLADLAPHETVRLVTWCGVEYRQFDSSRTNATWERNYLTLSVWKPLIIHDCLLELPPGGLVLYADSSTRLHSPLSASLVHAAQTIGIVGRRTASPVAYYTHQAMVIELAKIMRREPATASLPEHPSLRHYMDSPMVCGCLSLWTNTPFVMERLVGPWIACTSRRACILPRGADGQDNHIGLATKCVPGLEGHCHRGDQSALSVILYEVFGVRATGHAPYLHNTSAGPETWRMCEAHLHGTRFTTERASWQSAPPVRQQDAACSRRPGPPPQKSARQFVLDSSPSSSVLGKARQEQPRRHRDQTQSTPNPEASSSNCSNLVLTRVAVPTGIQPIFPHMGGPTASLKRFLRPCATEGACMVGADGCLATRPRVAAIGRCNATHGVEYMHRLPLEGEPAIVSFFNPTPNNVRDALAAIKKARPRLYVEFEPPVHARVKQAQVLLGVDGQMTYARRAMVHYPYFTPAQLWAAALNPTAAALGFESRLPAIAVFVSNCRGHRAEAIDWLRQRFEVHSYGACRRGGNTSGILSERRQSVEGGYAPECLRYRAVVAIENNACEDYVSEKLLEAVRCGAVPIVRTVKGLPDYKSLYGSLPVLDAVELGGAFEVRLRAVLTQRHVWESFIPSVTPTLVPPADELARLTSPNPHCQIIDVASRFRTSGSGSADGPDKPESLSPIKCETWYRLLTAHGIQQIPRT